MASAMVRQSPLPAGPDRPSGNRDLRGTEERQSRAALVLWGWRILVGAVFLLAWHFASGRLVKKFWISDPLAVLAAFIDLVGSEDFLLHLQVTFTEVGIGYVIGASLGIVIAFIFGQNPYLNRVFEPYIMAMYSVPRIAVAPLFIIWFGIGIWSKVVLVLIQSFFMCFFNTYSGVLNINPEYRTALRLMGASDLYIMRKVDFLASLPFVVSGLKSALPYAFVSAVVGEFIASSEGLGWVLMLAASAFKTDRLLAGILILVIFVMAINEILTRLESRLIRWRPPDKSRAQL